MLAALVEEPGLVPETSDWPTYTGFCVQVSTANPQSCRPGRLDPGALPSFPRAVLTTEKSRDTLMSHGPWGDLLLGKSTLKTLCMEEVYFGL